MKKARRSGPFCHSTQFFLSWVSSKSEWMTIGGFRTWESSQVTAPLPRSYRPSRYSCTLFWWASHNVPARNVPGVWDWCMVASSASAFWRHLHRSCLTPPCTRVCCQVSNGLASCDLRVVVALDLLEECIIWRTSTPRYQHSIRWFRDYMLSSHSCQFDYYTFTYYSFIPITSIQQYFLTQRVGHWLFFSSPFWELF